MTYERRGFLRLAFPGAIGLVLAACGVDARTSGKDGGWRDGGFLDRWFKPDGSRKLTTRREFWRGQDSWVDGQDAGPSGGSDGGDAGSTSTDDAGPTGSDAGGETRADSGPDGGSSRTNDAGSAQNPGGHDAGNVPRDAGATASEDTVVVRILGEGGGVFVSDRTVSRERAGTPLGALQEAGVSFRSRSGGPDYGNATLVYDIAGLSTSGSHGWIYELDRPDCFEAKSSDQMSLTGVSTVTWKYVRDDGRPVCAP